jgi:carbohydrate diacid regulator
VSENNDLSGELLETVRVFFLNDLNLTATAKQLYIHRNTLNYRLDKIRKLLHLDVRSFRDAVVFKIITDFPVSNSQVK